MVLNVDQSQRRDIDEVQNDRLTLGLDEENLADNPYVFEPTNFIGNNWFKQGNNIVKLNLTENDSIVFTSNALSKLSYKDITNIIVEFDYSISNVSLNYPILSNMSLTIMDMTNYMLVENILTTQGHIEVDCSLFNFSSNVVNTAISEQGFKVGINWNGNKSNATVKLSNVKVKFAYDNKLSDEMDSVVNRLVPNVDFYKEGNQLILEIGDADGKGHHSSGGSGDSYTKDEINEMMATKVDVVTGKGLSTNDYTTTEKVKLGTVETNANYYVHPSSHNTTMIVESSALSNIGTSANATQDSVNSAIDTAISSKQDTLISGDNIKTINNQSILGSGNITIQGGSGTAVIGTGSFRIDNNGHLIVELPNAVDNPYYINNNGHLVYDTTNTHNEGLIQ